MSSPVPVIEAVLINDTSVNMHHGCSSVVRAIRELSAANGIRIIGAAPAHRDWRSNPQFMAAFDRARIVIVNGEGTLHHSRPAAAPLLAAGGLARTAGKCSSLINFSWFENDSRMGDALQQFDLVSARESLSRDAVSAVRPDCRLVPDLCLYGPPADSRHRSGTGFGDSVFTKTTDELLENCSRFGGRFLPMRFSSPGPIGGLRLARSFFTSAKLTDTASRWRTLRRAVATLRYEIRDTRQYLAATSALRVLVTGRFHGVALALRANTPVLAVASNTRKVEALLADAGLEPWRLVTPQQLDTNLLSEASRCHGEEEKKLRNYLVAARDGAEGLFRDLRALV